ncbi:DUF5641 domain-containing protein [Trichonephila clavipes]|nr:DUF5641 domain-containing protein [Trichonephila clavipes]
MDLKAQRHRDSTRTAFYLKRKIRQKSGPRSISGTLLQLEDNGEEFETDFTDAESYREKYLEYYTHIDKKLGETVISEVQAHQESFKLPKLELRKFGGDRKVRFRFGVSSKFMMTGASLDEDKMQYLVASVEPKSKAERLILSFRLLQRYPKAVDQLKESDLEGKIYLSNLCSGSSDNGYECCVGRAKTDLSGLYDELEGKLRALESLGRTQEKSSLRGKDMQQCPENNTDEQILNNLRELNIEFTDSFSEGLEIDLLVGSNVLGRILMKKCCELDSGLIVVETKLRNL